VLSIAEDGERFALDRFARKLGVELGDAIS